MKPPVRRIVSSAVWTRIRAEYLGGETAEVLCRRYGVSLTALRTHARRGGWRRSDAPIDFPTARPSRPRLDGPLPSAREIADMIWRNAADAVREGDAVAAARWSRMQRDWAPHLEVESADPNRHLDRHIPSPAETWRKVMARIAAERTAKSPEANVAYRTHAERTPSAPSDDLGFIRYDNDFNGSDAPRAHAAHLDAVEIVPIVSSVPSEPAPPAPPDPEVAAQHARLLERLALARRRGDGCDEHHWTGRLRKLAADHPVCFPADGSGLFPAAAT